MSNVRSKVPGSAPIVGTLIAVILTLLASAVLHPPGLESVSLASMVSTRDSCTEQSIGQVPVQAQTWKAQTFTPSSSYRIYFADLPGTNLGGTTTLHIKETGNGQPIGADLATASTTSGNRFIFATPLQLDQHKTYALVLSNLGGSYHWSYSGSASCLSLGDPFTSVDGGLSWSQDIVDFNFIIHDSDSTPEPTPTATPTFGPALTRPKVFVISFPVSTPARDPQLLTEELIAHLKEASTYHGYSNRTTQPYLEFQVFGGSVVKYPELPPKLPDGHYDYSAIYDQYDICRLIQNGQVDEVWFWSAGDGGAAEWVTIGPEWSSTWGMNPPYCGKQVTTMCFNYDRGMDVALESFHHRLEGLFMTYFPCDFWTETWPWTYWPSKCSGLVSDRYGFVGRPFAGNGYVAVCGDAHAPPNILDTHAYDYSNQTVVQSICEDWQWGGTATVKSFNCEEWGCNGDGYHVWWMQNIPGLNNRNRDRNGRFQPNWWSYLFGTQESTKTPTPTQTRTPTPASSTTPGPYTAIISAVRPVPPHCVLRNAIGLAERTLEINGANLPTSNHSLQFEDANTGATSIRFGLEVNWGDSKRVTVDIGQIKHLLWGDPRVVMRARFDDYYGVPVSDWSPEFILADDAGTCGVTQLSSSVFLPVLWCGPD